MNVLSFEEANNIYESSNETRIKVHSVPSTNLQMYNRNISLLFKAIGDDGKDDFWSLIISELKRFRFDLSAAPLSKNIVSDKAKILGRKLKNKINYCDQVYSSELAAMLNVLAEQAQQLSSTVETNLLDFLVTLASQKKSNNVAIAICETRLIPLVEETIAPIGKLQFCKVVSPSNLREAKCYSTIFVIGAPKWFPEFVFSSPRSNELNIIKHEWVPGNWNPDLVLISPFTEHQNKVQPFKIDIDDKPVGFIENNPEEWIPRIDIRKIQDNALGQLINLMDSDEDIVLSRLFLLENDWAVFLDANDNSSVDIIDLDEEIKKRVKRVNIREVQSGMFILLRTEGGGDYIVPVADHIMGISKEKARADQKRWKMLLREQVKKLGQPNVISELRQLGSNRATNLNLEHWMSFRGIRTENYDDFLSIMKLIDLENEADQYWETMGVIRTAHTKAGFSIRSMLLDLVNKSDLDRLKRHGKMDFELAEQGAGSLSAFRVIDIAEDTSEVIHWKIGEPFRTISADDDQA